MFDVRPQPSQTSCADTRSRFVFQPSVASNVAELAVLRVKGARGVRARLYWERRAGECGSEVEPGAPPENAHGIFGSDMLEVCFFPTPALVCFSFIATCPQDP